MDLANDKIDPELKEFVVAEQIKSQIRGQIRKLNNICFDKCIEKPSSKLESKQENYFQDDQTFLLIRLPKETIESANLGGGNANGQPVGTLVVGEHGTMQFHDKTSGKSFKMISNHSDRGLTELHDLIDLSTNKGEVVHLGKVTTPTVIAVPESVLD